MQKISFLLIVCILFFSCKNANKEELKQEKIIQENTEAILSPEDEFTQRIENVHQKSIFMQKDAVQFDIELNFNGKKRLDATITMVPNSTKIRIDKKDGSSLIYDGSEVFLTPANADDKGARFDMFTWTYFFALPYKLNDNGTKWEVKGDQKLNDQTYDTARLTFNNDIGDSSKDWYVLYADKKSNRLYAAGYIVTFGNNDPEKAAEDSHAISYTNYEEIDGIPFATTWTYYEWTLDKGFTKQIGDATLSNIKFVSPAALFFQKPEDRKIIPL